MESTTVEDVLARLKELPNDAELYQQLGGLYLTQGELMKSWDAFMQSFRLNPDDPWTCMKFGTLLTLCGGDMSYARTLFHRAIKLDPSLATPHWCLGALFRKQGRFSLAERAYERAVQVDPRDEQAREKLAEWRSFSSEAQGTGSESSALARSWMLNSEGARPALFKNEEAEK